MKEFKPLKTTVVLNYNQEKIVVSVSTIWVSPSIGYEIIITGDKVDMLQFRYKDPNVVVTEHVRIVKELKRGRFTLNPILFELVILKKEKPKCSKNL